MEYYFTKLDDAAVVVVVVAVAVSFTARLRNAGYCVTCLPLPTTAQSGLIRGGGARAKTKQGSVNPVIGRFVTYLPTYRNLLTDNYLCREEGGDERFDDTRMDGWMYGWRNLYKRCELSGRAGRLG
ncbi:uncharacterized protein B0T23DRAFT_396469 [Neurospora hispaniola]|uniref:Uncharacterized protein n=1 Tax=Neurospora hispaniola TaxID=588809 RepID=A0AAJ0I4S9_9PEZI|nr:hypothetical protein B0T23DRAFT_396469 [Neurospora hispaniola]